MHPPKLSRRELLQRAGATALVAATFPVAGTEAPDMPHLLIVGDWGRDGALHQTEVARKMASAAQRLHARGVVSVGDNFYNVGVQSVSDPHWSASFEAVYAAPALQIPWYVALGNHDYLGVPQAQIDYCAHSARWRMPARYYKVSGGEVGAPYADLFFIDTSPLVNEYRTEVHGAIAANVRGQDVAAQLQWLDAQLAQSRAPWKLVIGHHTLRSGGSAHGDTAEMVDRVLPLLRKHGVQAYINGHDHDLQHICRDGMNYLCCGGGSEGRPVNRVDGMRFGVGQPGFATLGLAAQALHLEFIDTAGARIYAADIDRAETARHLA